VADIPSLLQFDPDETLYPGLQSRLPGEQGNVQYWSSSSGEYPPPEPDASIDPSSLQPVTPAALVSQPPPEGIELTPKEEKSLSALFRADALREQARKEVKVERGIEEKADGPPPAALGAMAPTVPSALEQVPQSMDLSARFRGAPGLDLRAAKAELAKIGALETKIGTEGENLAKLAEQKGAAKEAIETADQKMIQSQMAIEERRIQDQAKADQIHFEAQRAARADVQTQIQGLQNIQSQLSASKADPSRFWESRDLGQKAAIAIGLALGTFGSVISGGKAPNHAFDILERAIDRDIEAQRQDIQRLGMQANLQQNLIAQSRAVVQDQQAEYTATKAMMLDQFDAQTKLMALRFKDETSKHRITLLGNDAATMAADLRMKTFDRLTDIAAKKHGAQVQMAVAQNESDTRFWGLQMKMAADTGTPGVLPGQSPELEWLDPQHPPAKKEYAARASKEWEDGKLLDKSFAALIKLGQSTNLNPAEYAKVKALARSAASQIQLYVQKVNRLGVPSVFDYTMIKNLAPDPKDWNFEAFAGISTDVLKQTRRMTRERVEHNVRGENLKPKPGYGFPELSPEEEEEE